MKLLDVLSAPWAIQPEKLLEIQAIYTAHTRGEQIDIAALEARLGRPLANEPQPYTVVDGVAVLPLEGVIAKRANMFTQISGGVSSELAGRDLKSALGDPAVHSIVLAIDSPGGAIDGTGQLADLVMQSRGTKPIVAHASGMMASAAYWIGSAASRVYVADATTVVGSIGVVAVHKDVSKAEAAAGVKTTEVVAGKFKRAASQYAPLTDEGRATIQDQVDYVYSLFVGAVATQRGVSEKKVLADMADGRLFVGQQALDAGLVDGISTLGALVAQLNEERAARAAAQPKQSLTGATTMQTLEQILAESPDAAAALIARGADAERARIQAVEGALIPGHEALIAALKFDGKTSGGDAALAVNAAERAARARSATALAADAPKPVAPSASPAVVVDATADEDKSLPVDERCKAKWESSAAVRSEFATLEHYTAYTRADEAGKVRVLGKRAA